MSEPILAGFHPDPSICRVGDDYYLVASSFEYFPGVPVFTSRDLVSWRQLGSILDRPSQLNVRTRVDGASGGIYAPTLRHHGGRFWMTTTNLHDVRDGHLIVHAVDPAGAWSEPVYTNGLIGIDPDLAWDDDGVCHITWSDVVNGGISQAQVDPSTGALLSEPREIWRGAGGAHPEGPHVFRRGEWWYLLAAEGGTAAGHMVTVARARDISGPYESNPGNPILTHRSSTNPVQSTGHADMVEVADGSWAVVHLGTRPRGSFPKWHTNGRETFIAGVDWVEGWPVVVEDRYDTARGSRDFVDTFSDAHLHSRWVAPGVDPATFSFPSDAGLALKAGRSASTAAASRLLAVRVADQEWTASVLARGDVSLTVRIDDAHQAMIQREGAELTARVVIGPADQVLDHRSGFDANCELAIRSVPFGASPGQRQGPDRIELGVLRGGMFEKCASIDGRYLSTEVAGGFTGRMVGVEALGADALIEKFVYTSP